MYITVHILQLVQTLCEKDGSAKTKLGSKASGSMHDFMAHASGPESVGLGEKRVVDDGALVLDINGSYHQDNNISLNMTLNSVNQNENPNGKDFHLRSESDLCKTTLPPDGGWGWVVLLAGYIAAAMNYGLQDSYGLFYTVIVDRFGLSITTLSWIGSFNPGIGSIGGVLAPVLLDRLGFRLTGVVAAVLVSGGLFLSTLTENVYILYITFGALPGCAFYIMLLTSMTVINSYFERKRPLALGLYCSSAGMGSIVLPPLLTFFMISYGFWGTFLLAGGINLHQLCCSLTFRPLPAGHQQDNGFRGSADGRRGIRKYTQLLRSRAMWLMLLSVVAECMANYYFASFVPTAAKNQIQGITLEQTSLIVSMYGLVSMVSRILTGVALLVIKRSVLWMYIVGLCGSGVVLTFVPLCSSYPMMMFLSATYGFFYAFFISLQPLVTLELFGHEFFTYAYGLIFLAAGVGGLFGLPLGGFAADVSFFNIVFYIGAAGFVLAGLAMVPLTFQSFRANDDVANNFTVTVKPRPVTTTRSKA